MNFEQWMEQLNPEQREKVRACKTRDELREALNAACQELDEKANANLAKKELPEELKEIRPELLEKIKDCQTEEELKKLLAVDAEADDGPKELEMDELEAVSGGGALQAIWDLGRCQLGFHDYYERQETITTPDGWAYLKLTHTCRRCGKSHCVVINF